MVPVGGRTTMDDSWVTQISGADDRVIADRALARRKQWERERHERHLAELMERLMSVEPPNPKPEPGDTHVPNR
jgi:hypothetical protein